MRGNEAPSERSKADELASDLRAQGFRVFVEPKGEELPPFLKSFSPDIVAEKDGGGIVIEVLRRGTQDKIGPKLARLSEVVRSKPGWQFQLVIVDPPPEKQIPEESTRVIGRRLVAAQSLAMAGDQSIALVAAWAAIEAAMRFALSRRNQTVLPSALISECVHLGLLSDSDASFLRSANQLRNRAAHGFAMDKVGPEAIDRLIAIGQKLLSTKAKAAA